MVIFVYYSIHVILVDAMAVVSSANLLSKCVFLIIIMKLFETQPNTMKQNFHSINIITNEEKYFFFHSKHTLISIAEKHGSYFVQDTFEAVSSDEVF